MAQANCPVCGGTGWKTVEEESPEGLKRRAVICDCSATDRATRALERARLPQRYLHCDFENFDLNPYDFEPQAGAWNRSLEQARLVVEAFARDFPLGTDSGLLLMGPCGAGKTHLAVAALRVIVMRGHVGLFYDYRELLKEIQASYNPVSQTSEMDVLEPVLKAELLLLDDLGASKPSAWALDTVGHILNTRYNEKRITLITTNYLDPDTPRREASVLPSSAGYREEKEGSADSPPPSPVRPGGLAEGIRAREEAQRRETTLRLLYGGDAAARVRDETLGERVGHRIRSRLYEMCRTVEIVAPDYRKEIRQAGRVRA